MTTRRRQRVRIRARGDMTTQESEPAKAKPSASKIGNPNYAKARAKLSPPQSKPPVPPRPKPKAKPKPVEMSPNERQQQPVQNETPEPVEEALMAKDLVAVDDILANPVLTPNEVGTLLRVSPTTVMRLVQDGDLPSMQVSKETRMLRIDVLHYIRDLRDQRERHEQWHDDNPRFGGKESVT